MALSAGKMVTDTELDTLLEKNDLMKPVSTTWMKEGCRKEGWMEEGWRKEGWMEEGWRKEGWMEEGWRKEG